MVSTFFLALFSWYSFFKISPLYGNYSRALFVNGNPAYFQIFNNFVAVSGSLWDENTKIAEISAFGKGVGFNFIFYNFGNFKYGGLIPDDETNLNYSAFAYKIGLGYTLSLDRNLFFGIQPQYQRFEYYNQFAEGFTMNVGILHFLSRFPLYYEIFFKDFGLSSSEGYNFPGALNAGVGFTLPRNVCLHYLYSKDISNGGGDLLVKGVVHRLAGVYSYKGLLTPSLVFYLGDDLKVFNVAVKFRFLKSAFVHYSFTFRKSGFAPVHNITVGVE